MLEYVAVDQPFSHLALTIQDIIYSKTLLEQTCGNLPQFDRSNFINRASLDCL